MRKLEISNAAVLQSTLKEETTHTPAPRFLHRLHCVLLVARGCSCYQIAEWFGEHPCTVERWVHYFQEYGIEGLRDEQKTGRPKKVRDDQFKRLQSEIAKKPVALKYNKVRWDGKLLQTHLDYRYNIELSVRQCQRLLNQLRQNVTLNSAPLHQDYAASFCRQKKLHRSTASGTPGK